MRVKGGDPFIFGRGGEECDALREAGVAVDVISGLTAGIAAPAAIGVPVTDRRFSRGVALVAGHTGSAADEPDWPALARCGLTLVIYMGVARMASIAAALAGAGMAADTPAAVICNAHTAAQRQLVCTLGTLTAAMAANDMASPAIVVVGDVVSAAPMWSAAVLAARAAAARSSRAEPGQQLRPDLGVAEQIEVAHAAADPLVVGGEGELPVGIGMPAERAGHRHQAVAAQGRRLGD